MVSFLDKIKIRFNKDFKRNYEEFHLFKDVIIEFINEFDQDSHKSEYIDNKTKRETINKNKNSFEICSYLMDYKIHLQDDEVKLIDSFVEIYSNLDEIISKINKQYIDEFYKNFTNSKSRMVDFIDNLTINKSHDESIDIDELKTNFQDDYNLCKKLKYYKNAEDYVLKDEKIINEFIDIYTHLDDICGEINKEVTRIDEIFNKYENCKPDIEKFIDKYEENVSSDLYIDDYKFILNEYTECYDSCLSLNEIYDDETASHFISIYDDFENQSIKINEKYSKNLYDELIKGIEDIKVFCDKFKYNINYGEFIEESVKKEEFNNFKKYYDISAELKNLDFDFELNSTLLNDFIDLYSNFYEEVDKINEEYERKSRIIKNFQNYKDAIQLFISKYKKNVSPDLYINNYKIILNNYSNHYNSCKELLKEEIDGDNDIVLEFIDIYDNFHIISSDINSNYKNIRESKFNQYKEQIIKFNADYKYDISYDDLIDETKKNKLILQFKDIYALSTDLLEHKNRLDLYPEDQEALSTFKKLYAHLDEIIDKINNEYYRRQNLYESFLKCKNNIHEFIDKYKTNVAPDLFILNPQTILESYSKYYQICDQLDEIKSKLSNEDMAIIKEFLELYANFNEISAKINRLFVEKLYNEWKKSKSKIISFCNDYKFNIDYNNPIDDRSKKIIISELKTDYEVSKKLKKYANLQDYKLNDGDNELLENFMEIYENFNEIIEDINNEYTRILKTQQLFKHNLSEISNFISKYKTNVSNDLYIDDYLSVLKENKHYFDICNDLKTILENKNYVIVEDKNVLINFIKIYDNFKNVSSQINEAYVARKYNEYLAYKPKINSINSKFKNLDAKLYIENKNDFVEDNVHINNLLTELIKIKKDLNKSDLTLIKDFLRIFNEFNGGFVSEISESFKNNKHVLTKIINKFTVNLSFDEYIWDKNEHLKQYNKQITLVNNSDVLNKNNDIELSKSDINTIENFMDLIDNFDEVILKNNEGYVEKIKLEFLDKKDQISNFTKQYNDKSVVDDYITNKMKNKLIKQYSDLNKFLLDINSIPEFINQSKKRDLKLITKFLDTYANFDEIIFKINKRYVNRLYKENKDYISQYSKTNELHQDFYISNMKLTELLKYHKETYSIVKKLQNYCLDYEYLNDTSLLESFPKSTRRIKNHYKEANDAFVKKELRYKKKFFNDINGLSLDDQQREAVVIDEDTTHIIAGAGTGKTLTLQAKIKYLIEKRKVKPDEIIALSYSNASVSDLKSKIDDDIDIRTIHSLGNHILEENGEEPNADDEAINRVIDDYFLNKVLKNEKKAQRIVDFYSYFRYPPIDLGKISTKGELYDKEAGRDFESLKSKSFNVEYSESYVTYKREYVKSLEELYIANFLYIHGVEYEYERIYKIKSDEYHCLKEFIYSTSELPVKEMNALINQIADEFDINDEFKPEDMTYIRYKPDFYLPEYGIYLEHFGVDRNCQANWLNPDDARKYHESLIWKRRIHEKYGTKLLETYSYYQKENRLLTRLEEKLKKECVSFNPISYQEIYQRLIDNDNLNKLIDLIKLIKTFINHFKGNNLDKSEFKKIKKLIGKEENEFVKTRHTILYNIIKDVYDLYQKYLNDNHLIDFNDMINQACESIEQKGCPITYKYILVDEYQDVSYMRYSLLKAIQDDINSKIVVVGDDWQSIYRFSGCDVGLFSKINNYYEHVETRLIETTYRNSQELIDISGYFVMKNAEQIPKELTSEKSIEKPD